MADLTEQLKNLRQAMEARRKAQDHLVALLKKRIDCLERIVVTQGLAGQLGAGFFNKG